MIVVSVIKKKTINSLLQYTIIEESTIRKKSHREFTDEHLAKSVCAKIEVGNIRSALRILISEDKPTEDNDAAYNQLIERHPSALTIRMTPVKPGSFGNYLQVNEDDVKKAIFAVSLRIYRVDLMVLIYNIK